jgi:hypothetical protein
MVDVWVVVDVLRVLAGSLDRVIRAAAVYDVDVVHAPGKTLEAAIDLERFIVDQQ